MTRADMSDSEAVDILAEFARTTNAERVAIAIQVILDQREDMDKELRDTQTALEGYRAER